MNIPYVNLGSEFQELELEILKAVRAVMTSGDFILGRAVEEFETRFAALHDLPYAVGVGSGLDALVLTLEAMNIGSGDEVITVPNSFIATTAAITQVGARPVFVDVDDEQTMNPDKLSDAIGKRTKAIIPVHLTGRPAQMEAIVAYADVTGIPILEDCAQAVGASLGNKPVGTFGVAGCYSFHPLKNLGACGDAGAIVTGDKSLAERLRQLRNHGLQDRNTCVRWGHNTRLDTLQAAILNVKLSQLENWTQRRCHIAARYFEELRDLPVRLPSERPGEYCVWHAFVIQSPLRDNLQAFLRQRGIETLVHYPIPIHLQPATQNMGYGIGSFPVCESQAANILSLPVRQSLRDDEVGEITGAIKEFFQHHQTAAIC